MAEKILIADENPAFAENLRTLMIAEGWISHLAYTGQQALEKLHAAQQKPYSLIILDFNSKQINAKEILKPITEIFPRTGIFALAACADVEEAVEVMRRGAVDFAFKPYEPKKLLPQIQRALQRIRALRDNLFYQSYLEEKVELSTAQLFKKHQSHMRLYVNSIEVIARAIEAKDPYTQGHSKRVSNFSRSFAEHLKLEPNLVGDIEIAGLLHDVGKIGVPERILGKPEKLTAQEYDVIKAHPTISLKILDPIEEFARVKFFVVHHHEKWDGTGYPSGLAGEQVPLGARVLSLADAFDTMWIGRRYHAAWTLERVKEEFVKFSGTQFDPDLVQNFLVWIDRCDKLVEEIRAKYPPRFRDNLDSNQPQFHFGESSLPPVEN